jgi:acyl carrier protein
VDKDAQSESLDGGQIVSLELVIEAIESVLPRERVAHLSLSAETTVEELGVASIQVAQMLVFFEDRLGAPLDIESVAVETLGDLTMLRLEA